MLGLSGKTMPGLSKEDDAEEAVAFHLPTADAEDAFKARMLNCKKCLDELDGRKHKMPYTPRKPMLPAAAPVTQRSAAAAGPQATQW